jgi:hypothetical protein
MGWIYVYVYVIVKATSFSLGAFQSKNATFQIVLRQ